MKTISSSSPTSPRARFSIRRRLCSDDFFLKFYHRRVANGGVIDVLQSFYVAALLNLMRSEADAEMFWVGTEADGGYGMLDQHGQPKPVASLIVGILIALLIAVGMFFLLVSQQ